MAKTKCHFQKRVSYLSKFGLYKATEVNNDSFWNTVHKFIRLMLILSRGTIGNNTHSKCPC